MQDSGFNCKYCGFVDHDYDENSLMFHKESPKHICNKILYMYKQKKKGFSRNGDGILIYGHGESLPHDDAAGLKEPPSDHHKIWMYVKPHQQVDFFFSVTNDMRKENLLVVGIQLAHPQPQFEINENKYEFGKPAHILKPKSSIEPAIIVRFLGADVGQYEMPLMLTFHRESDKKNFIFVREMVISVQTHKQQKSLAKSPYADEAWKHAKHFVRCTDHVPMDAKFKIPPLLKKLLPHGLKEDALEKIEGTPEMKQQLRQVLIATRAIFDTGITQANYTLYFHHLLWWEETISRINLRKYNMFGVTLKKRDLLYLLEVPGLAENRPSLLRGDKVFLRPHESDSVFEGVIKDIEDSVIHIGHIDDGFAYYYSPEALVDVRFMMSRVPMERAHDAVSLVFERQLTARLFPRRSSKTVQLKPIYKWYNPLIQANEEQRSAVQHILSKTSHRAPYMVFGPPGTGKTMTIVEAIIQVVMYSSKYRVMVCTDSNMAADHIALMLARYNKKLNIENFILRANSQSRVWSVMPAELAAVSNGSDYKSFYSVSNHEMAAYRIVVTTLLHAAKYGTPRAQHMRKLEMTHLFIDEAAQASEPAALVPAVGLLAPAGALVLAGDPQQLGPVCISREARDRGLGVSLMERLKKNYSMYSDENLDPNYGMMLKTIFRCHADILSIPNELFYNGELKSAAKEDRISTMDILHCIETSRAIVFHGAQSKEQRDGKSPSFYNDIEAELVQDYADALVNVHKIPQRDIGVVTPYTKQVARIKEWLDALGLAGVEVGTVESFQGKEKRVIIVSCVRANCDLFAHDAKFRLGFVDCPQRFNVALTRAKAKLVVIGNPLCLQRDPKWLLYMQRCRQLGTYAGFECGLETDSDRDAVLDDIKPVMEAMVKAVRNCQI